jgi:hypothetical protein
VRLAILPCARSGSDNLRVRAATQSSKCSFELQGSRLHADARELANVLSDDKRPRLRTIVSFGRFQKIVHTGTSYLFLSRASAMGGSSDVERTRFSRCYRTSPSFNSCPTTSSYTSANSAGMAATFTRNGNSRDKSGRRGYRRESFVPAEENAVSLNSL